MKIALLSLAPLQNYGGILQSYALQETLERLGHKVDVISMPQTLKESGPIMPLKYLYRLAKERKYSDNIFYEKNFNNRLRIRCQELQRFVDTYLHVRNINSFNSIKKDDYDAIIVGSDQVWRPIYFKQNYNTGIKQAFLYFARNWNVKRIAYAASFGIDEWEYSKKDTVICNTLISKFDFVSVRESSGVELCKKYLSVKATQLSDPTLLLSSEDYLSIVPQTHTENCDKILVYYLDSSTIIPNLIETISEHVDKSFFYIGYNPHSLAELNEMESVERWLSSFNDASFVITDSFHACMFSLIFNKPFVVVENKSRGLARITSLLKSINQDYRLVKDASYINDDVYEKPLKKIPNYLSNQSQIGIKVLKKFL